jgi:hypothetical protein
LDFFGIEGNRCENLYPLAKASYAPAEREVISVKNFAKTMSGACANSEHFIQEAFEFLEPRAGDDHRITASVGFFGNPQKATPIVFTEFDEEVLALDLNLARLKYGIHQFTELGTLSLKIISAPVTT